MTDDIELTLWFGCVLPFGLPERLETARAGGFAALSVAPIDILRCEVEGLSRSDVRGMFADAGIKVATVDPLTKWVPRWEPPESMSEEDVAFCDFETDEVLGLAADLGAPAVSALELLGNELEPTATRTAFHALCERAAEYEIRVGLEFVPFTGIPDLPSAWEIVRDAPANAGIVVDAWHLFRGPDPEGALKLLEQLPGERIVGLQLDDAPADPWDDLRKETWERRRLPGEGAQDLPALIAAIDKTGARPVVGPEVLSPETWAMPPDELGPLLAETTRNALRQGSVEA
jgi:sugar phosphate isomerase/epimerase